ncbi:unnamed protein product [Calypogeia fissa]
MKGEPKNYERAEEKPLCSQGQLLYHLEAKYPGLRVTVWANKDRIEDLQKLQHEGGLKDLDLCMEEVYGEVPFYDLDPKFPVQVGTTIPKFFEECQPFREKLVAQKDTPGRPTAIVADLFQHWSKDLADELGVPWYTYYTPSPLLLVHFVEASEMTKAGLHPKTSPNLDDLVDLLSRDFPTDRSTRGSAILLNTSEEQDSLAGSIAAVRKLCPSTRILTIGPSLQYPGFGKVYTSTDSASNCLQWLNSQAPNSVLYVAFGSLGFLPNESVMELAAGLEASGVPFLWALKVKILAHASTGGFLSHSGWNSTLESLCAGVPLIAWPLAAEQPLNARFIADVAKVVLGICHLKDKDQYSFEGITRQAVTKAVKKLMLEKKGEELRNTAAKVQKSLLADVTEGGFFLLKLTFTP